MEKWKKGKALVVFVLVILALSLAACGSRGKQGPPGEVAVAITTEAAGANCAIGGYKVDFKNDEGTVLDSMYVCNGANGESPIVTAEAPGSYCAGGGVKVEVLGVTNYICNGADGADGADGQSVAVTVESAGANCANGGLKIQSVGGINYVCNGAPGMNGANGQSVAITVEPVGANCANGGLKLVSASGTNYVCNGISINWLGSLAAPPSNPQLNDAYHNTTAGISYVWDGGNWEILSEDGTVGAQGPQGIIGPTVPVIQSLSVWGVPSEPGDIVTAAVAAQSAEGLGLTYFWATSPGWVISSGQGTSIVDITAPSTYGAGGTATVIVTDTHSRSAVGTVALSTVGNLDPVISTMTASPNPAMVGQAGVVIGVTADDPNGDSLSYGWLVPAGWSITGGDGTAQITADASPLYASSGLASVTVTDGQGGSVSGSITVGTVANAYPVIESISIYPQPATAANFTCDAYDPYGDALSYTWKIGGVYPSVVTGASWYWYSQGIPGYYRVDVKVSDDCGGTASGSSFMNISSGSPWPRFHRDIQSTGLSPYAGAVTNTLKWKYLTGAQIMYSSPAVGADGTVYVGSYDNCINAIRSDGTLKWKFSTTGANDSPPAVGADGTIYAGAGDYYVYALNPDGTLKWKYYTGLWVTSSPTLGADGTVYVGSMDNYIYALKPDGTLRWRYLTGGSVISSPALGAGGTVYIGSNDGYIYALRPDGSLKWRYQTGGQVGSSPALGADGAIYVGSGDGYLYALRPDGALKWRYQAGGSVYSSPAVGADGTIYMGANDNYLYALRPDGALRWRYQTDDQIRSSPAVGADGTIYVGSQGRYLYAVSPDGTFKWRYLTAGQIMNSPAIGADGTVYIGSADKYLYAIR